MKMRLGPIVTLFALSFGAAAASAQVPGADASPYPMEPDRPAAAEPHKALTFPLSPFGPKEASKAGLKETPKLAAKPNAKPAAATTIPAPPQAETQTETKTTARPETKPEAMVETKSTTAAIVLPLPRPDAIKAAIAAVVQAKPAANQPIADQPAVAPAHERELGWSVVADPATGVQIGLPTRMVPHAREAARGTLWSSAHGEVQVETFRIIEPGLKLSAMFEQEKKEPNSRKVEYSLLRDDSYFVSGIQGLKKFSVRASLRNGEVRGFTMLYDQGMEGIVAPVMVAMSSAFTPFPQRSAPFAALSKSVEYGNGVVVSAQGHIVTDARLTRGCQVIVASGLGDAERIAEDKDNGLALLRVYGPRKFQPLAMTSDTAAFKSADVTLAGIPDPKDQTGRSKITEIKARVTEGNSIELLQSEPMAGFSGAAALDSQGRFVGMMEMRNAILASTEPSIPPVRLVRAAAIRGFLDSQNVPAVTAQGTDASASVVRIICVRK